MDIVIGGREIKIDDEWIKEYKDCFSIYPSPEILEAYLIHGIPEGMELPEFTDRELQDILKKQMDYDRELHGLRQKPSVSLNTLEERQAFVQKLKTELEQKMDLSNIQVYVFGSFLTEDYIPRKSDIDIGVYSPEEVKMYDAEYELDMLLNDVNLPHDIVIMYYDDRMLINIAIMVYGKTLTDYRDEKALPYIFSMVQKYGFLEKGLNPERYAQTPPEKEI